MATTTVYTSLYENYHVVRHVASLSSKNLIIDSLRDAFRNDRQYPYRDDIYGYPLIPDHTDMPDEEYPEFSTKIQIGDIYRFDALFYPAVIVRHTGTQPKPISFNQDILGQKMVKEVITDGYGERFERIYTSHLLAAGAWEQTLEIKIMARSTVEREEIADIILLLFQHILRHELIASGIYVKKASLGGESEEDYRNDKLYIQTVNLETFSEWRVEVPVDNVVERINFCFDIESRDGVPAPNLTGSFLLDDKP